MSETCNCGKPICSECGMCLDRARVTGRGCDHHGKQDVLEARIGALDAALEHIEMADGDLAVARRNIENKRDGLTKKLETA